MTPCRVRWSAWLGLLLRMETVILDCIMNQKITQAACILLPTIRLMLPHKHRRTYLTTSINGKCKIVSVASISKKQQVIERHSVGEIVRRAIFSIHLRYPTDRADRVTVQSIQTIRFAKELPQYLRQFNA